MFKVEKLYISMARNALTGQSSIICPEGRVIGRIDNDHADDAVKGLNMLHEDRIRAAAGIPQDYPLSEDQCAELGIEF